MSQVTYFREIVKAIDEWASTDMSTPPPVVDNTTMFRALAELEAKVYGKRKFRRGRRGRST